MSQLCNVSWAVQVESLVNDAKDHSAAVAAVKRFDEDLGRPLEEKPRGKFNARYLMDMMNRAGRDGGRIGGGGRRPA